MYVNVRTIDGKKNVVVIVSKTTSVEELKGKILELFDVQPEKQRLFYRGKQLVDGHSLFDYNINLNDVIQLMVKTEIPSVSKSEKVCVENEVNPSVAEQSNNQEADDQCGKKKEAESDFFNIGDIVDVVEITNGTWLEGKIMSIYLNETFKGDKSDENDGLFYTVMLDCTSCEELDEILGHIRPRSKHVLSIFDIKEGDHILANYNIDKPSERGHWYECVVTKLKRASRVSPEIYANIILGNGSSIENIRLKFTNEIMKLEERKLCVERSEKELQAPVPKRKTAPSCHMCRDRPNVKCKDCGCHICGLKNEPNKQIMCDECDMAYHLQCLDPPLDCIPSEDEWFCPSCKNDENEIVKAGEKLKESKKKAKMASSINSTSRDWGKGMACVGRTKECTLVPPNHYGPIPGVEVGTCWKFRLQVSEVGVHRPHVAGIHGRETDGAYSIVLSGGYEDDVDDGETFMYTGSGGRDLSGNKRTAEQSCDQTLTRMNKALALNCNGALNEKGAKAKDWKEGKPIRVVRNYKAAKHSKYAPEEGNRYDGIYKVVEYYPQKGKSGFIVWRYVLRRDDPTPAPWTKEGKTRAEKLGLKMLYPEGYLEAEAMKVTKIEKDQPVKEPVPNKGKKRSLKGQQLLPFFDAKKLKKSVDFNLDDDVSKTILADTKNEKLWNLCKDAIAEGRQKFLSFVTDTFMCICCQEVVHDPVTTNCKHNFCLLCLKRSFKAEVYSCPTCRSDLGKDFSMDVNESLSKCLLNLFPGYNVGR